MSCTTTKRFNGVVEAATAVWGKKACRTILAVADVADSLTDEFITVQGVSPTGVVTTYVVGKGTDPATPGTTFVSVTFATDATAAAVASAFVTALDGITGKPFKVSSVSGLITLQNRFIGAVSGESIGTSGFTLETAQSGIRVELGSTEGSLDFSTEVNLLDITTNQTGGIVVDQIFQGGSVTVSGAFTEITKTKFDQLIGGSTGDTITPMSGTAVTGFGESKLFQSLFDFGGTLILHPIRLPSTDYSADVVVWKCAPVLESTAFDGTAVQAFNISFNGYLDASVDTKINLWAKGDWTQEGLDA